MLVLDENLPEDQCELLRSWGIHIRVVGVEISAVGTLDENLIPLLHRLPRPTFCRLDHDFYRRDWAHASYGLVWLNVADDRAAQFIRRFLRHPTFNTKTKRMGMVARVHAGGVRFWKLKERDAQSVRRHDA